MRYTKKFVLSTPKELSVRHFIFLKLWSNKNIIKWIKSLKRITKGRKKLNSRSSLNFTPHRNIIFDKNR